MPKFYEKTPQDIANEEYEDNLQIWQNYITGELRLRCLKFIDCWLIFKPQYWLFWERSDCQNQVIRISWPHHFTMMPKDKSATTLIEYNNLDKDFVYSIAKVFESIFGYKDVVIKHNKKLYAYNVYGWSVSGT